MADYNATARTNYFRVKDLETFRADLRRHGLSVGEWADVPGDSLILDAGENNEPAGAVALFSRDDHGTWPSWGDDDELIERLREGSPCNCYEPLTEDGRRPGQEYNESNLPCDACYCPQASHVNTEPYAEGLHDLVARHLIDGDVAIFMEVGATKSRYLGGVALAVNSKGETRRIDLDDIYAKAAEIGTTVTHASY